MRRLAFVAVVLLAAGCHAQVPPATNHVVNLTWTAAQPSGAWAGCTSAAPCTYGVYRCSASAATCASTSNTAWSEVTSATTRVSGTSYSDSSANGLTAFYVVKTFQGASSSDPSNMAGPLTLITSATGIWQSSTNPECSEHEQRGFPTGRAGRALR